MTTRQIHPILVIEIVTDTADERNRTELQLRAIEQEPTSGVAIRHSQHHLMIAGEDELQLEAACALLRQTTPIGFSELRIGYRETIRKSAEAEGKYIRQTGGAGNYGHCKLRIEPNEPGKGYEFINDIKGDAVPKEYIKPIDQGVQGALELGILASYPIVDVKVTLFDGSYHEVDSNEMAFTFAGSIAFKEAARKASPVLLEPVMAVEVTVPEEFTGTIVGDINSRRGRIEGMEHASGSQVIKAIVPLAEVLRSSRHGRPEYSMHFARYQVAPGHDDHGDGYIPVPSLRPQRPNSDRSSAIQPDLDE